jgi:glycosyltransferase involved in cell wall biosynthesis
VMHLAVCSQTPLVRLLSEGLNSQGIVDLEQLELYKDYVYSPGGVTRMVYPLLIHMKSRNYVEDIYWVSLNPAAPSLMLYNGIKLISVKVDETSLKGYGAVKENMWKLFHGTADQSIPQLIELAWRDEYAYFNLYNRVCAETLLELDKTEDLDLFYIHDFQQLPTGHMLDSLKPKVFRWHIPFDEKVIPPDWEPFLTKFLNAYDAVIVSCKTYLNSLIKRGYKGKAYHIYPYIDFKEYRRPGRTEIEHFCGNFGIDDDDFVLLLVARLDPLKGHDIAVKALAHLVKKHPHLKLVFVGNGSFSSSSKGLGLDKAASWKRMVSEMAGALGVSDRVVFTGHLPQDMLDAAYERCDVFILPSRAEGFGLVVAEAWLHEKPVVVSSAAGISEIVEHGKNGLIVDPDHVDELFRAIEYLIRNEQARKEMGVYGRRAVEILSIERGLREEAEVLRMVSEGLP